MWPALILFAPYSSSGAFERLTGIALSSYHTVFQFVVSIGDNEGLSLLLVARPKRLYSELPDTIPGSEAVWLKTVAYGMMES